MQVTIALLASLVAVSALPADPIQAVAPPAAAPAASAVFQIPAGVKVTPGKSQCNYSWVEEFSLGHNHDVNTGSILLLDTVSRGWPAIMGSGCAPAWAVGGDIKDQTPTSIPMKAFKAPDGVMITTGVAQCNYSLFENLNLDHGHDVNTGSLVFMNTVYRDFPALFGSGCAPAWAVGGDAKDKTPTRIPNPKNFAIPAQSESFKLPEGVKITTGAAQCTYGWFENFNLAHGHELNTGSLKAYGTVYRGLPTLFMTGCAPAWAVGGNITDETPTKIPAQPLELPVGVKLTKEAQCQYNADEKSALGHNHEINTGALQILGYVVKGLPPFMGTGSGCVPAWAFTGDVKDETPIKIPAAAATPAKASK